MEIHQGVPDRDALIFIWLLTSAPGVPAAQD